MTFSIMTRIINDLYVTLSMAMLCILHYAECHFAECRVLFIVILTDIMQNVAMLSAVIHNVIMSSDVVPNGSERLLKCLNLLNI